MSLGGLGKPTLIMKLKGFLPTGGENALEFCVEIELSDGTSEAYVGDVDLVAEWVG